MADKVWIHEASFNLSREVGRRLAVSLTFGLLLGAGAQVSRVAANPQLVSEPAQDQNRIAAQGKFKEGEALRAEGTAESLRLAVKKYEEALLLWRAIGARDGEAKTLNNIGLVYYSLGENHKALNFYTEALPLWRAAGARNGEAISLSNIGLVYDSLGEMRKALASYTKALPLLRAVGARAEEATTLNNIGGVYSSLGEKRKALDYYNQALPLLRSVGASRTEAATLSNIGAVYDSLGEKRKALDFYNQALRLDHSVSNRSGEGSTLNNIGTVYKSLGENHKALDFYNQALPLLRLVGDRSGEAVTLSNIGLVYDSLGEMQEALDYYNQALPLQRAAGARGAEAITLNNIGGVYYSSGQKRKALDYYDRALALRRAVGDRNGEAKTLNNIGAVYDSLGEGQKALDYYDRALPLLRAVGARGEEGSTLNNIGSVYSSLGEKRKALDYYDRALALRRAVGDRNGEATTLNNIGAVYDSLGENQKALDHYNQALPLLRSVGARSGEASTLGNIGAVYRSLGENQRALDFYAQALTLSRAVGDRGGEAITLNNIGFVYYSLGEKRKALDFYTQALPLLRLVGDRRVEATTLNNIGAAYYSLGEKRKALDFYDQALPLQRAAGDSGGEASTLSNIGAAYDSLGEKRKALNYYNRALKLQREVGDRDGEGATLGNIAYAERALGRFDESRSHVEAALRIIESLRAKIVSQELRASYFATKQRRYEFYIDLLMQMHEQYPAGGHDATALEVSERARARSLLESLTEARADIRRGADPILIAQERSLQQRLNAKAEEALKLSANGADETRLAMSRREMDALTVELQQVQTQIRQTSPRYAALTQPQPLNVAEIQQQALDADTLLLEYSLGDERSFLWAVTPTSINSYELPRREAIEAAARRVYELLSDTSGVKTQMAGPGDARLKEAGGKYLEAASGLSRTLLGPVAGQLGKKRLLIVADGMLHYVPFGALPDPNSLKESDGIWQPLLVEHEIVNLASASTLAVLRRELAGRKPAAKTLAVLADPVFSTDDERIRPGARRSAPQTAQSDPLNESVARILFQIAGAEPGALRIRRLPFTRQEAERILPLAPAGAEMKALSFRANRETAMSDQLSQYRYVHFATHGLADSERPELSTIVLSLYDEQGRPQDGFLRAHEVYNLNLPAEMVTLSACETGLGKLIRGEGLLSLTRGFMYAGAARVVVSLWSVSDRATAELMTKFYRRALVEGERPAAALRAAQVEMWRDKRWERPYYWAAFTLQGEWR
jgi:tetratricopeptide (TPR) repeat protein